MWVTNFMCLFTSSIILFLFRAFWLLLCHKIISFCVLENIFVILKSKTDLTRWTLFLSTYKHQNIFSHMHEIRLYSYQLLNIVQKINLFLVFYCQVSAWNLCTPKSILSALLKHFVIFLLFINLCLNFRSFSSCTVNHKWSMENWISRKWWISYQGRWWCFQFVPGRWMQR